MKMPIKFPIPKPWAIFPKSGKKNLNFVEDYYISLHVHTKYGSPRYRVKDKNILKVFTK